MSHTARAAGAAIVVAAAIVSAATHLHAGAVRVIIRLYDTASIDPSDRDAAMRGATAILGAAGVTIDWRDCSRNGVDFPCRTVRDPGVLVVRIMPASATPSKPVGSGVSAHETDGATPDLQLGFAAVDANGRPNAMATIYRDRVLAVTRRAGLDFGDLLGRAMAHEIGHLLLRVPGHGRSGLMRGVWTDSELVQNRRDDWTFTPAEGRQMQSLLVGPDADRQSASATPFGSGAEESAGR